MAQTRKPRVQRPKVVEPAPPPVEDKTPNGVTIHYLARERARRKRTPLENPIINAFKVPSFPPHVEPPESSRLQMAQDENVVGMLSWAAGDSIYSAFAEGTTFLGYAYLAALAQRAEYRVVSEIVAYEMTREGITFESTGTEDKTDKIKAITSAVKRFKVMGHLAKAIEGDGYFGRGHIYVDTGDTDDADELKLPIGNGLDIVSKLKIKPNSLRGFIPVEATWAYPTRYNSTNPLKPDWYKPTTWYVMSQEVHETRFLTFVGRPVPDMLKPTYGFGGLSMSQMIKPYVDNWLRTRQSVADAIHNYSVSVLKTSLNENVMTGGDKLFERAAFFADVRDNHGVMVIDKNSEDFVNVQMSLAGLDALQAQTQEHMAAISRIPIVKLLGIQPAGLNASSEGEIRAFYDWIKAFQEYMLRPHLTTMIYLIMLSEFGEIDTEITFRFNDLWQLDEAGKVGIEKTKVDIDDAAVAIGAVSAGEVRKRLASDPKSIYHGLELDPDEMPDQPGGMGEVDEFGNPINPEDPDNDPATPKPRDPHSALASQVTNKALSFGSPGTGGFPGDMGLASDSRVVGFVQHGTGLLPIYAFDAKKDKDAVQFEHPAKGPHHCGQCVHFDQIHNGCELVEGTIDKEDWCKLFKGEGEDRRPFGLDVAGTEDPVLVYHGTRAEALQSIKDNGILSHPFKHYHPTRFYEGERGASVYVTPKPEIAVDWALSGTDNPADAVILQVQVPKDKLVPDEELPDVAERYVGDIPPEWIKAIYTLTPEGQLGSPQLVNGDALPPIDSTRFLPVVTNPGAEDDTTWDAAVFKDSGAKDAGTFNESDHPRGEGGQFTKAEADALEDHQAGSSGQTNNFLRDGVVLPQTEHLDSAIAKRTSPTSQVHRAIGNWGEHVAPLLEGKEGKTVSFPEYLSTSKNEQGAKNFLEDARDFGEHEDPGMLHFNLGEGHPGIDINEFTKGEYGFPNQSEVLLPRGLKFRLDRHDPKTKQAWLTSLHGKGGAKDEFNEADHPRGQPGNPGQFGPGGGGASKGQAAKGTSSSAALQPAPANRDQWPSHIKALRIPPAWQDVKISTDPDANLLAVGKDAKGRRQPIYSERFKDTRSAKKYAKVQKISSSFDRFVQTNNDNLSSTDEKTREHAVCLGLIMTTGVRPGSDRDTKAETKAYGATTLKGAHVTTEGNDVLLKFTGKKGVSLSIPVADDRLARELKQRAQEAGPDGQLFPNVTDTSLRQYTAKTTEGSANPKDFRTLLGTSIANQLVQRVEAPKTAAAYKAAVMHVAKIVSQKLGNTPSVALKAYISPYVFAQWKEAV